MIPSGTWVSTLNLCVRATRSTHLPISVSVTYGRLMEEGPREPVSRRSFVRYDKTHFRSHTVVVDQKFSSPDGRLPGLLCITLHSHYQHSSSSVVVASMAKAGLIDVSTRAGFMCFPPPFRSWRISSIRVLGVNVWWVSWILFELNVWSVISWLDLNHQSASCWMSFFVDVGYNWLKLSECCNCRSLKVNLNGGLSLTDRPIIDTES